MSSTIVLALEVLVVLTIQSILKIAKIVNDVVDESNHGQDRQMYSTTVTIATAVLYFSSLGSKRIVPQ